MILLDTHAMIWFMFDDSKLSERAMNSIKSSDKVFVSIASLWEIAIKQSIGKLDIDISAHELAEKCEDVDIAILPIKPGHLDKVKDLPFLHNDPFDRLIMAQAVTEGMALVTKDEKIAQYDINKIW
ncbi:type II toxin-antitoxin system VapC family toxin [Oribacterium sp. FC2011]|uniref:type II toxin-antitoxin system VapC family toxin n=1 Tax=Oribacterium sp. FC2011 TaxID=1408311 RepID=UPI0004E1C461|nr:type II toxin-antitoxin system VapC family toxin [Oribacterium sp. FC2011]